MIRTTICFFLFILFNCLIIRANCHTCHAMSQYSQCSTNTACGCFPMADAHDSGICGFLWVTCSQFLSCGSLNNSCYEPDHICIQHPRCHHLPLCYPSSMIDQRICPPVTTVTTTVITTTTTKTVTTTTGTTTTTIPFLDNCPPTSLVTFNDITTEPLAEFPSNYNGLQWKNFHVMNLTALPHYNTSGFYTALRSGYIAFNKYGSTMTISTNPPYLFNLYSFVASSGLKNQLKLTMFGERSSKVGYSATYPLYTHWQQLIKLNYLNIDKITFSTDGSSEFAMDDLCISISSVTTSANDSTTTTINPTTATVDLTTIHRTTTTTPLPQNCSTADLVTFDDIATETLAEIPSDYIGLQWKNFHVMNLTAYPYYNTSGFYTALRSGYIAYNKHGSTMTISVNPPNLFNLYSFVASSGSKNQLKLTMFGERSSKVGYSASYPLYTDWQQLIKLNYLNIDKITFSTDGSSEFAMDDLCISTSFLPTTTADSTTITN